MARADAGVVARERLPGHPASAGAARRLVRAAVGGAAPTEVTETAELLVSEVVTNAVVHAATDIALVVTGFPDGRVRVEVSDGSRRAPTRREYQPTATTGRGLRLLEELADACGTVRSATGKTVWFEVSPGPTSPHSRASRAHPFAEADSADAVPVALLGLPLDLFAAWREQADAMLRDQLLAGLDDPRAEEQVHRHAVCSATMSLLVEHVPATGADTPHASTVDVVVPVPADAAADFEVLDEALDRAITEAEAGSSLAPATDAAVRELRRWICSEIRNQVAGGLPTSWPTEPDDRVRRS